MIQKMVTVTIAAAPRLDPTQNRNTADATPMLRGFVTRSSGTKKIALMW